MNTKNSIQDMAPEHLADHLFWARAAREGLIDGVGGAEWDNRHRETRMGSQRWLEEHWALIASVEQGDVPTLPDHLVVALQRALDPPRYGDDARTAHHEAGHFVSERLLFPSGRWHLGISIDPASDLAGRSTSEGLEDGASREEVENEVVVLLAGFEAEVRFNPNAHDEAKTGASDDLAQVDQLLQMLGDADLDRERERLRRRAVALVLEHRAKIELVAEAVLDQVTLEGQVCDLLLDLAEDGDVEATVQALEPYGVVGGRGSSLLVPEWLMAWRDKWLR